jgi:hypothetical protein
VQYVLTTSTVVAGVVALASKKSIIEGPPAFTYKCSPFTMAIVQLSVCEIAFSTGGQEAEHTTRHP